MPSWLHYEVRVIWDAMSVRLFIATAKHVLLVHENMRQDELTKRKSTVNGARTNTVKNPETRVLINFWSGRN